MRLKHLQLCGVLLLVTSQSWAEIVDGVRQQPTYQTTGFTTDAEMYLYNVGSGLFFTEGNSWGTQASVGTEPLLVFFSGSQDNYILKDKSIIKGGNEWYMTFFDANGTDLYVDRAWQPNYYFDVEVNGNTFRFSTSSQNPDYGNKANQGLYVGLMKNSNSTALKPFVSADDAYVDWTFVTVENFNSLSSEMEIYYKAQELKEKIDKIKAINGDVSSLETVYLDESSSMAQLEQAITDAALIYDQSKYPYALSLIENATDKSNVDITIILDNPDFEESHELERYTTGWTTEYTLGTHGTSNNLRTGGTSSNLCYESWQMGTFDVYQELPSMPKGVYEIEVQGFYRYLWGGDEGWREYQNQNVEYVKPEGVPVYVYLNNNSTPFGNIYSEPVPAGTLYQTSSYGYAYTDPNGQYWYPNEMFNSAIAFEAGMYKRSAFGLIANDGDAFRIGVKGSTDQSNGSWCIWDNFKLRYRGFKEDVVQPILETAMSDLNQYANMLMGKTEYAELSTALTAAQTAIDNQDGEAMFAALNALYDVKESVKDSKDLFLEREVAADLTSLQEAITSFANSKMSKATLTAATTLAEGIAGNTIYEGTEINQLKNDVYTTIDNINTSVYYYSQLNTAIQQLTTTANTAKAQESLINEANQLVTTAQAGYNNGTIADADVNAQITSLNDKNAAINLSASKYTSLNGANALLAADIAEASTETARVAKTTLQKAQDYLAESQTVYNEATTGNDAIDARVKAIGDLREELMYSINLYKDFNAKLAELKTALEKQDKMSAATKATAQDIYDEALTEYDECSVDDDKMAAKITVLSGQIDAINSSIAAYKTLASAISALEPVLVKKAQQTIIENANTLYTTTSQGYANGTIADNAIAGIKDDITTAITQVNASASKYAELAVAITELTDAIALAQTDEKRVAKSTMENAQVYLTETQALYDGGTIADGDIDARIAAIGQLEEALTHSILLYQQFGETLANLQTTLAKQDKMYSVTRETAQGVYETAFVAYNEGTVDDDEVEAQIAALTAQITAINSSISLYADLAETYPKLEEVINLKALQTLVNEANTLYTTASTGYPAESIADKDIEGLISSINAVIPKVKASAALYTQLAAAITRLSDAVTAASADYLYKVVLQEASQSLSDTQKVYDDGTILDADIPARINTLDEHIAKMDASKSLYRRFKASLVSLQTVLAKEDKMSSATKAAVQAVYDQALIDYNEGNVADEDIEALLEALLAQEGIINNSIELYKQFYTAIEGLKAEIDKGEKVAAATLAAAQTAYNNAFTAYNNGAVADVDVQTEIDALGAQVTALQNSAALYQDFNTAIETLKAQIDKGEKVSSATLEAAQTAHADALTAYNEGSVTDDQVPAQITALGEHVTALENSAALYAQLAEALPTYDAAVKDAKNQVSSTMLTRARTLQTEVKDGYENGKIADDDVLSTITSITNAGNNLRAAFGLYAKVNAADNALKSIKEGLEKIGTDLPQAKSDVNECYIASDDKAAITARLEELTATFDTRSAEATALDARLTADSKALSNATSKAGLKKNYVAALTAAQTDIDDLLQSLTPIQPDVDDMLAYLAVQPADAIAASANIIELTAQYGTFCSTVNLDFTDVEGLRAYIVSTYLPDGNKVVMTRVNVVPAGTGIVVVGTPGGRYEVPKTNAVSVTSNMLVGTTRRITLEKTVGDKTNCILANGQSGIGFYPTSGGELAPAKAYLPLPTAILEQATFAKGVKIVFDDATRLDEVRSAELDGTWYSVGGQKLSKKPSQSGVYVKDGRKVVVK